MCFIVQSNITKTKSLHRNFMRTNLFRIKVFVVSCGNIQKLLTYCICLSPIWIYFCFYYYCCCCYYGCPSCYCLVVNIVVIAVCCCFCIGQLDPKLFGLLFLFVKQTKEINSLKFSYLDALSLIFHVYNELFNPPTYFCFFSAWYYNSTMANFQNMNFANCVCECVRMFALFNRKFCFTFILFICLLRFLSVPMCVFVFSTFFFSYRLFEIFCIFTQLYC